MKAEEALALIRAIMNLLDTPAKQDWVAERLYREYVGYLLLQDDEEPEVPTRPLKISVEGTLLFD